jgi:hypothetical protein
MTIGGIMSVKQYKLNVPEDVKAWLVEQSKRNLRSQSQEVILALREKMEAQSDAHQK